MMIDTRRPTRQSNALRAFGRALLLAALCELALGALLRATL
jgi:hypothetical protein